MALKYGADRNNAYRQFPELDLPASGVTAPEYQQMVLNLAAGVTDVFTVSLAGTSTLSGTVQELHQFTVTLAGTSSLAATVQELHKFTVTLAGTSALTATTQELQRLTVTLAGTSALTATLAELHRFTVTLAGTSALLATVTPFQRIAVALAGTSSLAATVAEYHRFTVSLAGTSALSALFAGPAATDTGCDILLESGGLILLEAGGALLRETCVDAATGGGNRLFGPPRRQQVTERQELAFRFVPGYVLVDARPATLSLGYAPAPAVIEVAARSASPTMQIRTGAALVETFHRATPDQRTVDLDSELAGLVRDVLVALEA